MKYVRSTVIAALAVCLFAAAARAGIKTQWVDHKDGDAAFELNVYSGTEHVFSTPKDAAERRADNESKVAATGFFKQVFGL